MLKPSVLDRATVTGGDSIDWNLTGIPYKLAAAADPRFPIAEISPRTSFDNLGGRMGYIETQMLQPTLNDVQHVYFAGPKPTGTVTKFLDAHGITWEHVSAPALGVKLNHVDFVSSLDLSGLSSVEQEAIKAAIERLRGYTQKRSEARSAGEAYPQVIATRADGAQLVDLGGAGYVELDGETWPLSNTGSLLARGYWDPIDSSLADTQHHPQPQPRSIVTAALSTAVQRRHWVTIGGHHIFFDESVSVGGPVGAGGLAGDKTKDKNGSEVSVGDIAVTSGGKFVKVEKISTTGSVVNVHVRYPSGHADKLRPSQITLSEKGSGPSGGTWVDLSQIDEPASLRAAMAGDRALREVLTTKLRGGLRVRKMADMKGYMNPELRGEYSTSGEIVFLNQDAAVLSPLTVIHEIAHHIDATAFERHIWDRTGGGAAEAVFKPGRTGLDDPALRSVMDSIHSSAAVTILRSTHDVVSDLSQEAIPPARSSSRICSRPTSSSRVRSASTSSRRPTS